MFEVCVFCVFCVPVIHFWRGLDDGAQDGTVLILCGWRAEEHGLEEDVRSSVEEGGCDAVEELHGCAEGDVSLFDTAFEDGLIGASEDVEAVSEFGEDGGEERNESFEGEFLADGDEGSALVGGEVCDDVLDECVACAEGIWGEVWEFDATGSLVIEGASAAPCEAGFLSFEACEDAFDAAFVSGAAASLVGIADEVVLFDDFCAEESGHVEGFEVVVILYAIPPCEEGDALSSDGSWVWRYDDFASCTACDGSGEGVAGEWHALTEDDLSDGSASFDAVKVILDDGVVDSGDDLFLFFAGGDGLVDDFGHKDGAMLSE